MEQTPNSLDALFAFLVAGLLALLLTPLTARLAARLGAIDQPNERSLHGVPTPKLGGLAILAGALVAGLIWLPADAESHAILIGAVAITLVGVADDVFDLNPAVKLLGQAAAVIVPVAAGATIDNFTVPFLGRLTPGTVDLLTLPWGGVVHLGDVATVIGIVAVINVINLIDGVAGLAAGVCAISAITLAIVALSLDRTAAGVLAALTAGASLGLLRPRFPPPRGGAVGGSPPPGPPARQPLDGRHRLEPARLPARRRRRPGSAEDECRHRPLPAADHPHRADPRHRLRCRHAAQVPAPDLPRRPLALPPPAGPHRLLPAPDPALPLRLDDGDGGAGAGSSLHPLQRRPRSLRPPLDRCDGGLRPARPGRQRLPRRRARDPAAAPGAPSPDRQRAPSGRAPGARRGGDRPGRRPGAGDRHLSDRRPGNRRVRRGRGEATPRVVATLTKWLHKAIPDTILV